MKSLLKGVALFVALTCLVWIAVLWHWRATQRDMDAGDIVLYLGLLPIALFGLALAVRWAVGGALAKQDATLAAAPPKAAGAAAPAQAAADARPALAWHLLGAWVNVPGGASAGELLAAIEAGKPRPKPDAALRDDDGLPVMSARVAELDTAAVDADLARSAALALPDAVLPVPPARAVRALACLAAPLQAFAQAVNGWALHLAAVDDAHPEREPRFARVLAAWPADWDDATCLAAQDWISARLCEPTADTLMRAQWSIRGQRMTGAELLAAGERVLDALQRQGRDDPVVLLACHSDLDAAGIRALARDQHLFHLERRPKAPMPGEGAALLALSARAWPAGVASDERLRFDSPAIVRRAQSIDTPGRTASDDAVRLVEHSLATARLAGDAIAKLACDADQHTPRATELFAVTLALLPGLDAIEDLRLAGTVCGRLGPVAPLVTLAMAAQQAAEAGQPAVALSLGDTHWRMAAVVRPDTSPLAAAPA